MPAFAGAASIVDFYQRSMRRANTMGGDMKRLTMSLSLRLAPRCPACRGPPPRLRRPRDLRRSGQAPGRRAPEAARRRRPQGGQARSHPHHAGQAQRRSRRAVQEALSVPERRARRRHRLAGRRRAALRRGDRRPPSHRRHQHRAARRHDAHRPRTWSRTSRRPRLRPCCRPTAASSTREGRWTPWYWSEHGISYNSSLVPKDKAPTAWTDLCNPFFKGSVSFDPAEDRYLSGLYAIMGEEATEKLLKCIGENDPIIQRGHTQRIELMLAGDHMVQGDNYLYHGVAMQRKNPSRALRHRLFGADHAASPASPRSTRNTHASLRRRAVDRLDADQGEPGVRRARCCAGRSRSSIPICPTSAKIVTYNSTPPEDVSKRTVLALWNKIRGQAKH